MNTFCYTRLYLNLNDMETTCGQLRGCKICKSISRNQFLKDSAYAPAVGKLSITYSLVAVIAWDWTRQVETGSMLSHLSECNSTVFSMYRTGGAAAWAWPECWWIQLARSAELCYPFMRSWQGLRRVYMIEPKSTTVWDVLHTILETFPFFGICWHAHTSGVLSYISCLSDECACPPPLAHG